MSAKMNLPKLRFGEFSDGWEEKKFEQVFKRVVTKNKENNLNVLTISAQQGLINQEEYFNKSVSAKDVRGYYLLEKNDFAYNKSYSKGYPLGAIKRLSKYDKGVVSTLYICFRIQKDSVLFLEQFFNSGKINENIHKIAQEGARNHGLLNISVVEFFKDIHLTLPSKPEQEKIASFLSGVDERLEQLGKKQKLLEEYKKGVMQKIFSQELRFKADDGSEFPEWVEKKLEKIGIFTKGKGISKDDITENGKTECIRYGELYTKYNEIIKEIQSRTDLNSADLVLSKSNDIIIPSSGETAIDIATASCVLKDGIALGGDLNIIRTNENGVFLSYYLNKAKKYDIAKLSQGSSVIHLYSTHLKSLKINLPSLKEQTKIANFLSSLDEKIAHAQTQLEQTKQFKKALLQKMFV